MWAHYKLDTLKVLKLDFDTEAFKQNHATTSADREPALVDITIGIPYRLTIHRITKTNW